MSDEKLKPKTASEKQKISHKKLLIISGTFMVIVMLYSGLTTKESSAPVKRDLSGAVFETKEDSLTERTVVEKYNQELAGLKKEQVESNKVFAELKRTLDGIAASNKRSDDMNERNFREISDFIKETDIRLAKIEGDINNGKFSKKAVVLPEPKKPNMAINQRPPTLEDIKREKAIQIDGPGPAASLISPYQESNTKTTIQDEKPKAEGPVVFSSEDKTSGSGGELVYFSGAEEKTKKKNPFAGYLMPGFVEATILTGISANTSVTSAKNPNPTLMRLQGNVQLAGNSKYKLKGCFVFGAATGSRSDERAHILLDSISCVEKDSGRILESKIKGYAVDSDSSFGVRGKLVERRGDALSKLFLAGTIQGISTIGTTAATGGVSLGGITGTNEGLDFSQIAGSAGMSGFSSATGKLADFYLKEVEAIFPVIEVPAGRKITIVITNGTKLEWADGKNYFKEENE